MSSAHTRRFLFVTGKGGSGKTTVSAALALALAAQGRRVLVTTSGARERLSGLLGTRPLTTSIEPLATNVWGVLLNPQVALHEYGTLVLKSPKLVEAVFGNRYVQGFFNGAPGLREWALLGKAWYHAIETLPNGASRFDVVVFDAPATGHSLDMLRVPKVILAAAPPGRLRNDAERALAFFENPRESGVIVVTLAEEMPTNETFELIEALRGELGFAIAEVVANALLEPLFPEAEARALEPFVESASAASVDIALAAAARRALAERAQRESLERLQTLGLPLRELPRIESGAIDHESLARLAALLA